MRIKFGYKDRCCCVIKLNKMLLGRKKKAREKGKNGMRFVGKIWLERVNGFVVG